MPSKSSAIAMLTTLLTFSSLAYPLVHKQKITIKAQDEEYKHLLSLPNANETCYDHLKPNQLLHTSINYFDTALPQAQIASSIGIGMLTIPLNMPTSLYTSKFLSSTATKLINHGSFTLAKLPTSSSSDLVYAIAKKALEEGVACITKIGTGSSFASLLAAETVDKAMGICLENKTAKVLLKIPENASAKYAYKQYEDHIITSFFKKFILDNFESFKGIIATVIPRKHFIDTTNFVLNTLKDTSLNNNYVLTENTPGCKLIDGDYLLCGESQEQCINYSVTKPYSDHFKPYDTLISDDIAASDNESPDVTAYVIDTSKLYLNESSYDKNLISIYYLCEKSSNCLDKTTEMLWELMQKTPEEFQIVPSSTQEPSQTEHTISGKDFMASISCDESSTNMLCKMNLFTEAML